MASEGRFAFQVEWIDPQASMIRQFLLFYYLQDKTIEMDDVKNRRKFLRRTAAPAGLSERDFFLGATVMVHSRQLTVVDFGDDYTRRQFANVNQQTFCLMPLDSINKIGDVFDAAGERQLRLGKVKLVKMTQDLADEFASRHAGKVNARSLSAPVIAIELVGRNAIQEWLSATMRLPPPIVIYSATSANEALSDSAFFFSGERVFHPTVVLQDCSLLIVKPSAVARGQSGAILKKIIDAGFEITAMELFSLNRINADEFLEVYKGVIPNFEPTVEELVSGALLAVAVCLGDRPCVQPLREICGPLDSEMARVLRPKTIRALFGKDAVDNAVHCTDLEEDGILEVEYFFKILQ